MVVADRTPKSPERWVNAVIETRIPLDVGVDADSEAKLAAAEEAAAPLFEVAGEHVDVVRFEDVEDGDPLAPERCPTCGPLNDGVVPHSDGVKCCDPWHDDRSVSSTPDGGAGVPEHMRAFGQLPASPDSEGPDERCERCGNTGIPGHPPTAKGFCDCRSGREKAAAMSRMLALMIASAEVGEKRGTAPPLSSHSGAELLNALEAAGWTLARAALAGSGQETTRLVSVGERFGLPAYTHPDVPRGVVALVAASSAPGVLRSGGAVDAAEVTAPIVEQAVVAEIRAKVEGLRVDGRHPAVAAARFHNQAIADVLHLLDSFGEETEQ
ncbi:MAG: hypothetical protein J0H98_10655 [Solirubrobacterales bacterium]|nr:hypothetical protein [Solirubrobacterales bacterium]